MNHSGIDFEHRLPQPAHSFQIEDVPDGEPPNGDISSSHLIENRFSCPADDTDSDSEIIPQQQRSQEPNRCGISTRRQVGDEQED
jgi:hypothetical protein